MTGDLLAVYEPTIRKLAPSLIVRACLAMDRQDYQAEARMAALVAIQKYRAQFEVEDSAGEEKYVWRSIRNHLKDRFRRARARPWIEVYESESMQLDHGVESDLNCVFEARTVLDRVLDARKVLDHVRSNIGDERFGVLCRIGGGERPSEVYPEVALRAAQARCRRIRKAAVLSIRRFQPLRALERPEDPMREVIALSTADLARVAVVYKLSVEEAHDEDPAKFRQNLIAQISSLRVIDEKIQFYPPCFATEFEDDGGCSTCAEIEACRPLHDGFRDVAIEARVAPLLKSLPVVHDVEVPEPAPPVEEKPPPAPARLRRKRKRKKNAVPVGQTPKRRRKRKRRKVPVPTSQADDDIYGTLTERRKVFFKGRTDYVRTTTGKRKHAYRPTGSAAMAKTLRNGHKMVRTWQGLEYVCKKKSAKNWVLVEIINPDTGEVEECDEHFESIGQLTKRVSGRSNWTGAKFFGLLPKNPKVKPDA